VAARSSSIYFLNMSGAQRRVYWVDYDGKRRLYRTLQNLAFHLQPSYVDARWIVTDSTDQCVASFVAAESSAAAVLRQPAAVMPELAARSCGEEGMLESQARQAPTVVEFMNRSEQAVLVHWKAYGGERMFYQTVPPAARFAEPTFATHVWVVTNDTNVCRAIFVATPEPGLATIR
jgi:hypothetical protein